MKTKILFLVILVSINVNAQDIHFSQFLMSPLLLNPSLAGKFKGDQRAIINYRNQWNSIADPFQTYGVSFDTRLTKKKNFLAGGVSLYKDKAGDINMGVLKLDLSLAYHVALDRTSYLSGGIQVGMLQRSIDQTKLEFDNQYDGSGFNPLLNSGEYISNPSFTKGDFSAGISYTYKSKESRTVVQNNGYKGKLINVGFATHNVSKPDITFLGQNYNEKLAFRHVFHFNGSFGIPNTITVFQPSGFIAYQQGAYDVVLGGMLMYAIKEKSKFTTYSNGGAIGFGAHYRAKDAFILTTMLELGSFTFGLSYDLNVSKLVAASKGRGGIEFSIRFINPNPYGSRSRLSRF